jgi:hypothetical protein
MAHIDLPSPSRCRRNSTASHGHAAWIWEPELSSFVSGAAAPGPEGGPAPHAAAPVPGPQRYRAEDWEFRSPFCRRQRARVLEWLARP